MALSTPRAAAVPAGSAASHDLGKRLRELIRHGEADLPLPGRGRTLERWSALAAVAAEDLSLAKLFEGHTDAIAILAEARPPGVIDEIDDTAAYGMWAAEAPGARVLFRPTAQDTVALIGSKAWCSGAAALDRALLTVWPEQAPAAGEAGAGPWLADVDLRQPGVVIDDSSWRAVGMAETVSATVTFESASARLIGPAGFYLSRPGFWQGGIGVAACWHGAACAVAQALRTQLRDAGPEAAWHRALALGEVDRVLSANAALLREAAAWVDRHPEDDARAWALRTRAAGDESAQQVLRATMRAMGAGPLCHDEAFARRAADLPVFIRQCHGDRDLVALGHALLQQKDTPWTL